MSSDQQSDVPGGYFDAEYFVGLPSNHAAEYFVGRPSNHAADKTEEPSPHAAAGEPNPAAAPTTKQSTPSFLAKCCSCFASGGAAV